MSGGMLENIHVLALLFRALKIDVCFMSNLGSLVSCLPDSRGHSLSLVLAKGWFLVYVDAVL
jgi:hypothetical protein